LPGGGVFSNQKVNAFYIAARGDPQRYPNGPEQAMKDMIGVLLGVRIDYYAMTTFDGFEKLANAMGGVTVNVAKGIVDPKYQVTTNDIGIRFKAGPQLMKGSRALIYVRTRGGDNDFERSRRQQRFLSAAGNQVLAHPELLAALLSARSSFATDLPLDQLPGLIGVFRKPLDAGSITGLVLGPRTYSSAADCPCGYALKPNVRAMQKAAARLFPWATEP
jgi:LCP family protein required for cell wall assembly